MRRRDSAAAFFALSSSSAPAGSSPKVGRRFRLRVVNVKTKENRMPTRAIVTVVMVAGALALCGCMPTKTGIEARAAARDRMNAVTAQIHYGQAKQSFETGSFDRASREIDTAIAIYAESAEYYILRARIHLETHRLEEALDSLETAMEKDAKLAEPHYYAGIVYQRWSDDREAHESYLKAFELEPTKVQYLLAAAESLVTLGEFEQARLLIEPKLAYFEHNAALRQLQGQIALLQGQPKEAAALYSQARMLNPEDDLLLEELVWAQYAAELYGDCHASLKLLQERCKDERADLVHLEARCLAHLDRTTEARDLYIQLTRLRPSDVVAWSELGALCWDVGDYRRVAQCSVQIISLAPERYEGYMLQGINERHKDNLEAAAELLAQAAARAPDVALPHLLLAQTLEQKGDFDAARLAYNDALKAQPTSTEARDLLRRLNERLLTSVP
jgi:tetratricopeptide (TPR) repeat protein